VTDEESGHPPGGEAGTKGLFGGIGKQRRSGCVFGRETLEGPLDSAKEKTRSISGVAVMRIAEGVSNRADLPAEGVPSLQFRNSEESPSHSFPAEARIPEKPPPFGPGLVNRWTQIIARPSWATPELARLRVVICLVLPVGSAAVRLYLAAPRPSKADLPPLRASLREIARSSECSTRDALHPGPPTPRG
jgi:hypothetical protein